MIISKTKINCIIIESDLESINILTEYLEVIDHIDLKASFTKPAEAVQYLNTCSIDIVFINTEIGKTNCFDSIEVVQAKRNKSAPKFVILASNDIYALKSYRYGILDYLVKPIILKDILCSIDKYFEYKGFQTQTVKSDDFFFADFEGKKIKICHKAIVYIQGFGNYVNIHCNDRKILLYKTMAEIHTKIDSPNFIRIHKSYIVALESIVSVSYSEMALAYQNELVNIPIGRTYKAILKQKLQFNK